MCPLIIMNGISIKFIKVVMTGSRLITVILFWREISKQGVRHWWLIVILVRIQTLETVFVWIQGGKSEKQTWKCDHLVDWRQTLSRHLSFVSPQISLYQLVKPHNWPRCVVLFQYIGFNWKNVDLNVSLFLYYFNSSLSYKMAQSIISHYGFPIERFNIGVVAHRINAASL